MNKDGRAEAPGGLGVTMTHALHSSGIEDEGAMVYGGEAGGYVLHFPDGRNTYSAGDTDIFAEMQYLAELHAPTLAFLPIGDHFTMAPRGAAIACRLLGCKDLIPMHHGTFPAFTGTPAELAALTGDLCHVRELTPGELYPW